MTCPEFGHDVGPYLLGALDESDRVAFATHLPGCAYCRAEVDLLRPVVTRLRDVGDVSSDGSDGSDGGDGAAEMWGATLPAAPLPDTLLPGLLAQAGRRSRRSRALLGALTAVAAAAVVALTVVLVYGRGGTSPTAPQVAAQVVAMDPVGVVPVSANATVTSKAWGTEITLRCRYRATTTGPGYPGYPDGAGSARYSLQVIDDSGAVHDLGSWALAGGAQAEFTSGTAVPRDHIRRIEVVAGDGTPVLSAPG